MAEFNITSFVDSLQDLFLNNPAMPLSTLYYMDASGRLQLNSKKHPNRSPLHLKDAIRDSFKTTTIFADNSCSFDLGNERMEKFHPYYHILENTKYIRKRDLGTEKTRGSQAKIEDVSKRDYEIVRWNGKTFSKEYTRNIRGSRNRDNNVTRRYGNVLVKREGNSYLNDHYMYIERIIDGINPLLAATYGLKLMRTQKTGLEDELAMQWGVDSSTILDIFKSFEE